MASIEKCNRGYGCCYVIRLNITNPNTKQRIKKCMTWRVPKGMKSIDARKEAERLALEFEEENKELNYFDLDCSKMRINEYSERYLSFIKKNHSISHYVKRMHVIKENYVTADFVVYTKDSMPSQISAMDEEQAKLFFNTLMNYPDLRMKTALLVFLLTGFRRGEVTALKWTDIDFDLQKITISRSATQAVSIGLIIKEPKTVKSARTIKIPEVLVNQLIEYKAWQEDYKMKCGAMYNDNDWVFTQENGNIINPNTFSFWLDKILDKANLPHFTIHSLRHTNITLQIAAGVPIITVAGRAGHSRTSTTTDIYSHFIQTSDNGAAEKLEKTLTSTTPKVSSPNNDSMSELIRMKAEMDRLGMASIQEYIDYLVFKQSRGN